MDKKKQSENFLIRKSCQDESTRMNPEDKNEIKPIKKEQIFIYEAEKNEIIHKLENNSDSPSKISLENKNNKNISNNDEKKLKMFEEENFSNNYIEEDVKLTNPFLTKDTDFFKRLQDEYKKRRIENGESLEIFNPRVEKDSKTKTLDSFLKIKEKKSENFEEKYKNKKILINPMKNFPKKLPILTNKNKQGITTVNVEDYEEDYAKRNIIRRTNINSGYINVFSYANKRNKNIENEEDDEEHNENPYMQKKYRNKFKNDNRYINKKYNKFQEQEEENSNEDQNVGFVNALQTLNEKKKKLNQFDNDDDLGEENLKKKKENNQDFNNKKAKHDRNKEEEIKIINNKNNINNINQNINADLKPEKNNLISDERRNSEKSDDNITNLVNRAALGNKYIPPYKKNVKEKSPIGMKKEVISKEQEEKESELDKKLKGYDKKMIEMIESEILTNSPDVKWDDIAGLDFAKKTIREIIIWPMLRPDIFNGIRRPPKGLLLFGPPGTGKTMIAKAIASESKSKFFNISASSLMSKWVGESEKLVRTLFALASYYQPSVVFIDEIDSILTSRNENECESSRRLKTEFLVQLDGAGTNQDDRILIIGATNRPQEIDEAFLRRLSKRLYIPLPNKKSRLQLLENVINRESKINNKYNLSETCKDKIIDVTKGYSGSDLMGVCREASMMPIRCIEDILSVNLENIRDVNLDDFIEAVKLIKPSVSGKTILFYTDWNINFGSFQFEVTDE